MEIYKRSDCIYGYRKITRELQYMGINVNGKKVLKLMKLLKIQGLYPKKKFKHTKQLEHKIYPYLLDDIDINGSNHVWATDITYIKIKGIQMTYQNTSYICINLATRRCISSARLTFCIA